MGVEILLILVKGNMAQKSSVFRLCMQNRVDLERPGAHLVVVNCQMGIELAGYTLKICIRRGEHHALHPAIKNNNTGKVGSRRIGDLPQPPSRAGHEQIRACQVRCRHGQIDHRNFGEEFRNR